MKEEENLNGAVDENIVTDENQNGEGNSEEGTEQDPIGGEGGEGENSQGRPQGGIAPGTPKPKPVDDIVKPEDDDTTNP